MTDAPNRGDFDPRLWRYLDGLMSDAERSAFEHERGGAAALRHEIELQSRLDDGLREMFAYEPPATMNLESSHTVGERDADAPAPYRGWFANPHIRRFALAACLLLAAGAFFFSLNNFFTPPDKFISPEFVYTHVNDPEFVCTTDEAFAKAINDRFGEPLVLAAAPRDEIVAVGWAYGDGNTYDGKILGDKTLVLITKVRGQKVLVLMDRKRNDRTLEKPTDPTLKVFRGETKYLVLYELTKSDKPQVLDHLVSPK